MIEETQQTNNVLFFVFFLRVLMGSFISVAGTFRANVSGVVTFNEQMYI